MSVFRPGSNPLVSPSTTPESGWSYQVTVTRSRQPRTASAAVSPTSVMADPHFVLDLSDGSLATPEFGELPPPPPAPSSLPTLERGAAIVENGPIRYLVTRD